MTLARIAAALLLVSSMALSFSPPVFAQDSRLTQEITGVDCVANPSDPTCPPTIQNILVNDGRPVISGFFNSSISPQLRVHFNGVMYVMGVDSELSVAGDDWTLDLSGLEPALPPGDYSVMVESLDPDGNWLSSSRMFRVNPSGAPDDGAGDSDQDEDQASGDLSSTGQPIIMAVTTSVASVVGAIILLRVRKRRS